MSGPIVLLTHSQDVYVPDLVAEALRASGADVVRVDTDLFPGRITVHADVDGGGDVLVVEGREIVLADVPALWARRRWPSASPVVEPRFAPACAAQGRALFSSVFARLGARVVNPVLAEDRAEDKLLQLRTARAVGFVVPDTIVTNDPERARAFVDAVRADGDFVITKLLVPLSSTMDGSGPFVYTRTLDDDDVAALADLVHAPQIFQRRVRKRLDVRVQVVGDAVFCGAFACTADDWREQTSGAFAPYALPAPLAQRCKTLCRAMGLVCGAIDLVVDDQGVVTFLELNPAGEWGNLQRDCGHDVAGAIASVLVAHRAREAP